jgi:hypothetical protein
LSLEAEEFSQWHELGLQQVEEAKQEDQLVRFIHPGAVSRERAISNSGVYTRYVRWAEVSGERDV